MCSCFYVHFCFAGEGQFGKVYECVNLDKGEVNAVKIVSIMLARVRGCGW